MIDEAIQRDKNNFAVPRKYSCFRRSLYRIAVEHDYYKMQQSLVCCVELSHNDLYAYNGNQVEILKLRLKCNK